MSERVAAVVPVKRLDRALMRLAGVLDAAARRELQEAMLADVLEACRSCDRLAGTIVVTSDPDASRIAQGYGARVIADHTPPRGIDAAVSLGLEAATGDSVDAAVVLFADLPLLSSADLEALLDAEPRGPVTIAVSRDRTGTNALVLRPPAAMPPALGPGSLARHERRAAELGITMRAIDLPGLTIDVDTPDDLAAFLRTGRPCATALACERIHVAEILAAGAR
jgi:2-phospho-L-lactate/phosphoenolpyruvate guanylyltransferase